MRFAGLHETSIVIRGVGFPLSHFHKWEQAPAGHIRQIGTKSPPVVGRQMVGLPGASHVEEVRSCRPVSSAACHQLEPRREHEARIRMSRIDKRFPINLRHTSEAVFLVLPNRETDKFQCGAHFYLSRCVITPRFRGAAIHLSGSDTHPEKHTS